MTEELKKTIQKEYNNITSFNKETLKNLAQKHNITLDELLNTIDL